MKRKDNLIKRDYLCLEKLRIFYDISTEWFKGYIIGMRIENWLIKENYRSVAVYGMGILGELTYLTLKQSGQINVKYALDKNKNQKIKDLSTYSLGEKVEPVQLIIVTAITSYEEIKNNIVENIGFECQTISLMQLLEKMYI